MPQDKRLFITIPLDFPDHPKVKPLSDVAKWAFVDMNIYSRNHSLDGVIPARTALAIWSLAVLDELVKSHRSRPLVQLRRDKYIIREYAKHQQTTAAIAARKETNTANGEKGGRPKGNRTETQSVSDPVSETKPNRNQSQESRVKNSLTVNRSSHVPNAPDVDLTKIIAAVQKHCGRACSEPQAWLIVGTVMSKAKVNPRSKTAFVLTAIANDPIEIEQMLDESTIS